MQQQYDWTINRTDSNTCTVSGMSGTTLNHSGWCDMGGGATTCPDTCIFSWSCTGNDGRCSGGTGNKSVVQQCTTCLDATCGGSCCTHEATYNFACTCTPLSCQDILGDNYELVCPRANYDNGCGGTIPCGTDNCTSVPGGNSQYECNGGFCSCVPDCAGKECGSDGCGSTCPPNDCTAENSCYTCQSGQCGYVDTDFDWLNSSHITPVELGEIEPITLNFRAKKADYVNIKLKNQSTSDEVMLVENWPIEYNCRYDRYCYQGGYECPIIDLDDYISVTGTYELWGQACRNSGACDAYERYISNPNSGRILVQNDNISGCTDESCADNYPVGCTPDVDCPTVPDSTCLYTGCPDPNANNYFCLDSETCSDDTCCSDSLWCTNSTYPTNNLTDNNGCHFTPIPVITAPPQLYEGNSISITCDDSIPFQNNLESYNDYGATITNCEWDIFDTVGYLNWAGDTLQLNLEIPLYPDEQASFGGGDLLTIRLRVTNSTGFTSEWIEQEINIGDVDIIGTNLSEFSSIYIQGSNNQSLIGCYLPPLEGGYDVVTILNNSFYDFASNPDDGYEGLPNGVWSDGDVVYGLICLDASCTGETKIQGSYSYLEAFGGWFATSGAGFRLYPGMGLRLQTSQPGWFKWGIE